MSDGMKRPPAPIDDGACRHLEGAAVPRIGLRATRGPDVDLAALRGRTVVYAYPRTSRPDEEPLPGWDEIPGARGCTPQSCAFRDHRAAVEALGARIFGLSTQDTVYQREAAERLHLPFALLSDQGLELTEALALPTFTAGGLRLLKRVTLILRDGRVEKVFYPVFPPEENAREVIAWLGEALAAR